MPNSRFSYRPVKFVQQIVVLDNLQLSDGTPPNAKKYLDWYWSDDESTWVTNLRKKSDEYWLKMINNKKCPPEIKDEMRLLIASFMDYDHGKVNPHKLLNKIADFGSIEDCEALGIKAGTPLAKAPTKGGGNLLVSKVKARISLRKSSSLTHVLTVTNIDTPDSRALPPGMKRAKVYCYVGKDDPTKPSQYEYKGNASRGLFTSSFIGMEPTSERIYAWYVVRYEDSRGNLHDFSEPLKAEIYFPAT